MSKLDYDPKLLFGPDYECDILPPVVTGPGVDYRSGYSPEPVRPSWCAVFIVAAFLVCVAGLGWLMLKAATWTVAALAAYARAE